jgi:hypothetical protein
MDIGALFLLLALLLLVALFVARPFLEPRAAAGAQDDLLASPLLTERDRVLTALQELDFDHTLGKIPAEEYPAQRASLLQHGADILRQLDELPSPARSHTGVLREGAGSDVKSAEARLAAAIASRRAEAAPPASSGESLNEDVEALIAKRRAGLKDKASGAFVVAGFCPQCGHPILGSDSFCPQCGYALK